jgi:hypothetical protein
MHIDEGARMTIIGSFNKALSRVALRHKRQLHSNPKEWKDEQLHQELQNWCRVILQLDTSPGDFSASICSQHRFNMRETEQKIMKAKDRIGLQTAITCWYCRLQVCPIGTVYSMGTKKCS